MTSTVPISRSSYASQTPDEAWEVLSQMYTQARPHAASTDALVRFDGAATPEIAVDRGWLHTASGSFDESPDQLNIISVTHGRIRLDFGRRGAIANTAGDSYLYLPDSAAELDWDSFGALTLRLPPAVVARAATELTGISTDALRFTSPRPVSPAHTTLWLHTVELLWRELAAPNRVGVNALVHQQLLHATTAAALSVFPNTAMIRGYVAGPGDVRPAAVRRAIAYIDAHASLPVTVTDIAHAAGTSPYALRAAFRHHLDTTPTAYLRRVRLHHAHRELQTTEPGAHANAGRPVDAIVAEIGARWGFARHDSFLAAYRDAFGVSPAATLRSNG